MFINKQYVIFIWIMLLILFLFYCIFRVKYIREKYYDISYGTTTQSNLVPARPQIPTRAILQGRQFPITTQETDVYDYINNIQNKGKVTDMINCEEVYDDNIAVRDLGYNNCQSAYSDYLQNNLDLENTYGMSRSLADICPVSAKTDDYKTCLTLLLNKFTKTNTIIDRINLDMTSSINKRIEDRSKIVTDVQTSLKSFISSKDQVEFNNNMVVSGQVANYPDERLGLVDNYYNDKYKGYETFTNLVYSAIETKFFGNYLPVKGQFIALNNLVFSINYDTLNTTTQSNFINLSLPTIPPPTIQYNYIYPTVESSQGSSQRSSSGSNTLPPINFSQTSSSEDSESAAALESALESAKSPRPKAIPPINITTKPVIFTISNNDLYITYNVENIDFYKGQKSAIILVLNNKTIVNQTNSNNNIVQELLSILGLREKSQLILIEKTFLSTEGNLHTNYTLANDTLDTILVLEKLK
jgi:hypothetical protein